jgi:Phosphodiester glycosidase
MKHSIRKSATVRGRRRTRRRALLLVPSLIALLLAISIVGAVRTPGNEAIKAKWADWLRSHHASVLVNHMEAFYYGHQAPTKGGRPRNLNKIPGVEANGASDSPPHTRRDKPTPVPLLVSPALPGEGQWQPTGPLLQGLPGMYIAQFRADSVYTKEITTAVWIDPTVVRVRLIPGASEPGGTWSEPPDITGPARALALAAFNGGFRFQDAHGGFYLDGRQALPLKENAASVVIDKAGHVNIGTWGHQVSMSTSVSAVLQNLVMLVDGGKLAPDATYTDHRIWGGTLGAKTVVARSGVGVTATGALVYVAGPALTVKTLAEALQRAGAVRAMTLDLNPEWVTFNLYQHAAANPGIITAAKLYPQMQRPATRYLGPTRESRDFFTVSIPG